MEQDVNFTSCLDCRFASFNFDMIFCRFFEREVFLSDIEFCSMFDNDKFIGDLEYVEEDF